MKQIYRGISDKELKGYKLKGIPVGKRFTTDVFMAKKHGKNIVAVNLNKTKFKPDPRANIFNFLKIRESYYFNKKPIKRFKKLMSV